MSDSEPTSGDDQAQRKHAAKVHNDRIKFVADIGKLTLGALIVGGVVRFLVDPNAPTAEVVQLVLTLTGAAFIGLGVWFLLGRQRPEE